MKISVNALLAGALALAGHACGAEPKASSDDTPPPEEDIDVAALQDASRSADACGERPAGEESAAAAETPAPECVPAGSADTHPGLLFPEL